MPTKQTLNPQLVEVKTQLDAASEKARSIVADLSFDQLKQRPQSDKWSIAECLVHLNLSSAAEIKVLNLADERARAQEIYVEKKFKLDWLGRILKWTLEPPPMFFSKMKTTDDFQPARLEPVSEILPTFLAWQERLKAQADEANGLPLDRIKVVSPFDRRVKYNLLSFFHITLAHERRHLWQAEKAKEIVTKRARKN